MRFGTVLKTPPLADPDREWRMPVSPWRYLQARRGRIRARVATAGAGTVRPGTGLHAAALHEDDAETTLHLLVPVFQGRLLGLVTVWIVLAGDPSR